MPTRLRRLREQERRERDEQEKQLIKAAAVSILADEADESDHSDNMTVLPVLSTSEQLAAVNTRLDALYEQEEAMRAQLDALTSERDILVENDLPALEGQLAEAVAQVDSLREESRTLDIQLHVFAAKGMTDIVAKIEASSAANERQLAEAKATVRECNETLQRKRAFTEQESQRLRGLIAQVAAELESIVTAREGLEAEKQRLLAIRGQEVVIEAEAEIAAAERQLAHAEARVQGARVDVQRVYDTQRRILRSFGHDEAAERLCPHAPMALEASVLAYSEFLTELARLAGAMKQPSVERDSLISALALAPQELVALLLGDAAITAQWLRNKQAALSRWLPAARRRS